MYATNKLQNNQFYNIIQTYFSTFLTPYYKYNYYSLQMNSDSLMSQLSNISSQLSNVSYRGDVKQYTGSQFFKDSLQPGQFPKLPLHQLRQEEIELDSLVPGLIRNVTPAKEAISVFTPYWTSDIHNVEGTSDNQNQPEHPSEQPQKVKQQASPPLQKSEEEENKESSQMKAEESVEEEEQKTMKNQTKNIPKNYGKAIIIFIQKNRQILSPILNENNCNYDNLLSKLRQLKKKINTISDLRNLWQDQLQSKCLRIISNTFLRKHSLHYIYNSRIKTRLCHAKYKRRLQQAILNPKDFNHIKDY